MLVTLPRQECQATVRTKKGYILLRTQPESFRRKLSRNDLFMLSRIDDHMGDPKNRSIGRSQGLSFEHCVLCTPPPSHHMGTADTATYTD